MNDGRNLRELFHRYKFCVVRIETVSPEGDLYSGTGFTIGNGLVVTASHVLDYEIRRIVPFGRSNPSTIYKIHRHPNSKVDVAVIETDFNLDRSFERLSYRYTDGTSQTAEERHRKYVQIGDHLDDWIGDELVLCPVLLLGYPRIPFANEPVLAASVGHVNAIVDRYVGPHPFFIVSSTPRAGFSGGPAITEYGALLGVITGSFVHDDKELELGFNGVLTIEPLFNLLIDNGLKPQGIDDEFWSRLKGE